jgi:hypothetical protein
MAGEAMLDSFLPGGAAVLTDPDATGADGVIAEVLPASAPRVIQPTDLPGRTSTAPPETLHRADEPDAHARNEVARVGGEAGPDENGVDRTGDPAGRAPEAAGRDDRKSAVVRGVGLGESRAGLVGTARTKSAAVARILDGAADGKAAWIEPILQQAPPTNARAATRKTPAGRVGPLRIGAGEVSAHARWDAGMRCGSTAGEAARSTATVRGASLLGSGDGALVRVPGRSGSVTTTALERRGGTARTVASATVRAGRIELAGGQVRVRVLRPPSLVASMSATGGQVRYQPALVEVSGPGIATRRLDAIGEHVEATVAPDRHTMEAGALGLGDTRPGTPLPLPPIPGLPHITAPALPPSLPSSPESDRSTPPDSDEPGGSREGTKLRISLGGVRQAENGTAIAARATAIKVSAVHSGATGGREHSAKPSATVSLDLAFGLMEAAAVATGSPAHRNTSGAAGGLPITGPRVAGLAIGGLALLAAGIAAIALGVRRRRSRP